METFKDLFLRFQADNSIRLDFVCREEVCERCEDPVIGMVCRLKKISEHHSGCLELVVDFKVFESYNKSFMHMDYWNQATYRNDLHWYEHPSYKKADNYEILVEPNEKINDFFSYLIGNKLVNEWFEFTEYGTKNKTSYVEWLEDQVSTLRAKV